MSISSICIPSIEKHITKDKIKVIFEKLGKVDYIQIKQSIKFSSAFIYMKNWNFSSSLVMKFYNKIAEGDEINLIYNFPWFWKCRANHDIRELKFNKLENQTVQYKENVSFYSHC